ncbi:MAG: phosphoglycerate dehydrogenase [bacterium]
MDIHPTTYIFDFDKTIVSVESLELLSEICLAQHPKRKELINKISSITEKGMNGEISFGESLRQRFALLSPTKQEKKLCAKKLKKYITKSILRNKAFFKKNANSIFVVSGGFKELIIPVTTLLGIPEDHIFANEIKTGSFDSSNPLAHEGGKITVVKSFKKKNIIFIGDGYTDAQIKEMGAVEHFVAFTEHVTRAIVVKNADEVVGSFDEFLYNNKLPMSLSYPKNKIKVVLLENIHPIGAENFKKEGFDVQSYEKSYSGTDLDEKVDDAMILGIRSRTQITADFLNRHPRIRAIGAYCIGTNQIDLSASTKRGIGVFNAPYSNTRSVVELAIGEMIMLMRGIFPKSNEMHTGIWNKSAAMSHELRGKKLGIIGYGNIGIQLSVLAESLGMQVFFSDCRDVLAVGNAQKMPLHNLLKQADIITVHVDGRKENTNLISEKEFALMKKGVIFLNLSRGFVVDIQALTSHMKSGHIRGAAIDVFPHEPKGKGEEFISPLREFSNTILTPHIAGSTEESQHDIGIFTTKKLVQFINEGSTELSVNMPRMNIPPVRGTHRLIHIHNNVPGILAQINSILAKNKMNIEQQMLKTNDYVGYVITDVNKKYSSEVLKELKMLAHTIRFHVIYS